MQIIKPSLNSIVLAVEFLKKGGVIVCPTDTVYGFLADASNKKAVDKIYKIKKRAKSKPLSVFVKDLKMAKEIAGINEKQEKMLKKYWPGKYTFILKNRMDVGRLYYLYGAKKDTVAVRIPKHPFLQKLLKKINRPLVQTSVNISAQEPLNSIEQIMATFERNNLIGLIIDGGDIKNAKSSKIVDLTKEKIVQLR